MGDWRDSIPQASQAKPSASWRDSIPSAGQQSAPAQSAPAPEGFIHATLRKTAEKMNVQNLLDVIGQADTAAGHGDYSGAWEALKQLNPVNSVKAVANDVMHGNASDIASDVVPIVAMADGVSGGRLSGAASDAVRTGASTAADVVQTGAKRVAYNGPELVKATAKATAPVAGATAATVLSHGFSAGLLFKAASNLMKNGDLGAVQTAAKNLFKMTPDEVKATLEDRKPAWDGVSAASSEVPPTDATPIPATQTPAGRVAGGIQNQVDLSRVAPNAARKPLWMNQAVTEAPKGEAVTPVDTPGFNADGTFTLPSGKVIQQVKPVPTDISTEVHISPKVSVKAASNAEGTSPSSVNTLDAPTSQRLAKAAQNGTANGLTSGQKADLVKAVRNGDNEAVHNVLDNHAGVRQMQADVVNKVAVLARYMKDHGINPDTVNPADYQTIADKAVGHAKTIEGLVGPRSGKYKGISPSTINLIKESLKN